MQNASKLEPCGCSLKLRYTGRMFCDESGTPIVYDCIQRGKIFRQEPRCSLSDSWVERRPQMSGKKG